MFLEFLKTDNLVWCKTDMNIVILLIYVEPNKGYAKRETKHSPMANKYYALKKGLRRRNWVQKHG